MICDTIVSGTIKVLRRIEVIVCKQGLLILLNTFRHITNFAQITIRLTFVYITH